MFILKKYPDTDIEIPGPEYINVMNDAAAWNANTYTSSQWNEMQAAGAVFLPAAGYRDGVKITNVGTDLYYWTGSHNTYYDSQNPTPETAKNYRANKNQLLSDSHSARWRGQCVRLVRAATAAPPTTSE